MAFIDPLIIKDRSLKKKQVTKGTSNNVWKLVEGFI